MNGILTDLGSAIDRGDADRINQLFARLCEEFSKTIVENNNKKLIFGNRRSCDVRRAVLKFLEDHRQTDFFQILTPLKVGFYISQLFYPLLAPPVPPAEHLTALQIFFQLAESFAPRIQKEVITLFANVLLVGLNVFCFGDKKGIQRSEQYIALGGNPDKQKNEAFTRRCYNEFIECTYSNPNLINFWWLLFKMVPLKFFRRTIINFIIFTNIPPFPFEELFNGLGNLSHDQILSISPKALLSVAMLSNPQLEPFVFGVIQPIMASLFCKTKSYVSRSIPPFLAMVIDFLAKESMDRKELFTAFINEWRLFADQTNSDRTYKMISAINIQPSFFSLFTILLLAFYSGNPLPLNFPSMIAELKGGINSLIESFVSVMAISLASPFLEVPIERLIDQYSSIVAEDCADFFFRSKPSIASYRTGIKPEVFKLFKLYQIKNSTITHEKAIEFFNTFFGNEQPFTLRLKCCFLSPLINIASDLHKEFYFHLQQFIDNIPTQRGESLVISAEILVSYLKINEIDLTQDQATQLVHLLFRCVYSNRARLLNQSLHCIADSILTGISSFCSLSRIFIHYLNTINSPPDTQQKMAVFYIILFFGCYHLDDQVTEVETIHYNLYKVNDSYFLDADRLNTSIVYSASALVKKWMTQNTKDKDKIKWQVMMIIQSFILLQQSIPDPLMCIFDEILVSDESFLRSFEPFLALHLPDDIYNRIKPLLLITTSVTAAHTFINGQIQHRDEQFIDNLASLDPPLLKDILIQIANPNQLETSDQNLREDVYRIETIPPRIETIEFKPSQAIVEKPENEENDEFFHALFEFIQENDRTLLEEPSMEGKEELSITNDDVTGPKTKSIDPELFMLNTFGVTDFKSRQYQEEDKRVINIGIECGGCQSWECTSPQFRSFVESLGFPKEDGAMMFYDDWEFILKFWISAKTDHTEENDLVVVWSSLGGNCESSNHPNCVTLSTMRTDFFKIQITRRSGDFAMNEVFLPAKSIPSVLRAVICAIFHKS